MRHRPSKCRSVRRFLLDANALVRCCCAAHRSEFRAAGRNGRAQSSEDRKTLLYMATTSESVADDRERTCPTKTKLISIGWTAQRAQIDPRGPAGRGGPGKVGALD